MQHRPRRTRRLAVAGIAAMLAATVGLGSSSGLATGATKPLPPQEKHFGKSYSQLAGDWWKWAGSFPLATNPIVQDGDVDCSRGQTGKIWFLAGNFGGQAGEPNPSERTCSIPGGKALFFPLSNALFWVPDDGTTVDEVRKKSNDAMDAITGLTATLDGVKFADLFAYRAQSPPGGFALPFGPLLADFGYGPTPDPRFPAVADGYWILLPPLTTGQHELVFGSSDGQALNVEVTYRLTVGGGR